MGTSAIYDLTKLKPDGSHYVAVGFAIPHCLQLPDGNYPVSIVNYVIPTSSRERPLIVQVVLEKRQKVLSQAEIHLAQRETWEMAGPHGTYGYSSILAYIPVRGANSEIHQDFNKMWSLAQENHSTHKEQAIIAVNQLIAVYRFCTGECHIRPLTGQDVRFEYSFALLFIEHPVGARESKFSIYTMPVYNPFDRLPVNLNIPDKVVSDIRTKLAESYQVPLSGELLLNVYDLIDRGNYRLAVIEAEIAFEAAVISFLRDYFKDEPKTLKEIERPKSFGWLINQPFFKDAFDSRSRAFRKGESPRQEWEENVATVRGDLVHGRIQDIAYEEAINAVETVEGTLEYLLGRNKTEPWRYAGPKILK